MQSARAQALGINTARLQATSQLGISKRQCDSSGHFVTRNSNNMSAYMGIARIFDCGGSYV